MGDPIMIDAHDIRFSYDGPGGRRSLNGAQLHVAPGEFVAVLGHNGCGKSTLVKHFNALLPLQHGTLTVDGMDAADTANRWALRRKVGLVFQNPDSQFVSTLVGEDVAFGLENYGVPEDEIPARVAAALAAVDMAGYENRATHTLSGGQQQRLCIARAILRRPKVLILDDSTSALDTATDAAIRQGLRSTFLRRGENARVILCGEPGAALDLLNALRSVRTTAGDV